jgi:prophage regulatory protein
MNQNVPQRLQRHLRRSAVEELTGLSRSSLYDQMKKGLFPRAVKLTAKAVAWREDDIANWLASRDQVKG